MKLGIHFFILGGLFWNSECFKNMRENSKAKSFFSVKIESNVRKCSHPLNHKACL